MKSVILFLLILIGLFVSGCAITTAPTIFVPQELLWVSAFYRNGLPIGTVNEDSSFMMVSLEPVEITGEKYMRLWFLYKNNSSVPFLLEPLKIVKLDIKGGNKSYDEITPESPAKILAHIENEVAITLILQGIGGVLKALNTEPTTISHQSIISPPVGEKWELNDKAEKSQAIIDKTLLTMSTTAHLYDIFKNSINTGILRRNTVFPNESVNGYIYFPLPELASWSSKIFIRPEEYSYKLNILTQSGYTFVEFLPALGE
jgi:hypothetical protein